MKPLIPCFLAFSLLVFGMTKERAWKSGKIIDYNNGGLALSNKSSAPTKSGPYRNEGDAHLITLQGGDYTYIAYEKHAWNSWCLLVVGDEVKYAQDRKTLYLVDATGAKCRFDVVKTEKSK